MNAGPVLVLSLVALSSLLVLMTLAAVVGRALWRYRDEARARHAEPVRPWLLQLAAGDPDDIAEAVARFAELGNREWAAVEPSLRGLLLKVRGDTHAAVVDVLTARGVLDREMGRLRHPSIRARAFAAELLGAAGWRPAVAPLITALSDRDLEVRIVAARALGRIGSGTAMGALLDSLAWQVPPRVVTTAMYAIAEHDPSAHESLRAALADPRPEHRGIAAEVAGLAGSLRCVPDLSTVLAQDDHVDPRIRAARALGRCGLPSVREPLERACAAAEPTPLRAVATKALAAMGMAESVPTLRALLHDESSRVAHQAAIGLARSGPTGVEALRRTAARTDAAGLVASAELAVADLRGLVTDNVTTADPQAMAGRVGDDRDLRALPHQRGVALAGALGAPSRADTEAAR